jgi:hypothetical protein
LPVASILGGEPLWSSLSNPKVGKCDFYNAHAATRKDVERAFRSLQAQFAIVRGPARFWYKEVLWYIMNACVIMHNMVIKDECGKYLDYTFYELMGCLICVQRREHKVAHFIQSYHDIRNNEVHDDLWSGWNGMDNKTRKNKLEILYIKLYLIHILFICVTIIKNNLSLNFMLCLILFVKWMLQKVVCRHHIIGRVETCVRCELHF